MGNPLLARAKCTPSVRGKKILDELNRLGFERLTEVASKAGVHTSCIRRVVYTDGPLHADTFIALRDLVGVSEKAMLAK